MLLDFHVMSSTVHLVEKQPIPLLMPIFRSQQQGELLAWLLDDPERETSLSDLANRLNIPAPSVHREVERAIQSGIVMSRKIGGSRLIRVNQASKLVEPLRQVLVMTFGAPARLGRVLGKIDGVEEAFIFGSWAARYQGVAGKRPVGDIDVLVIGEPNREVVYEWLADVEPDLGYPVQVTFRTRAWWTDSTDGFHETVLNRPLIQIVGSGDLLRNASAALMASEAH